MNNKSKRLNLIICGAAFIFMIVYLFAVDKPDQIFSALRDTKLVYLVLAIAFMVIYWLLESVNLHLVMREVYPKQRLRDSISASLIGQYFNCITPFSSGGQPIQAYYLMKFGAPLGSSLTALLSKFIAYQFVLTIYSLVILIIRVNYVTETNPMMLPLVIIGFFVNAAVIIGLLMLAFFQKPTKKFASWLVRLLGKIRIVKDVDAKLKYIDREMDLYHENFQFIMKKPFLVMKLCGWTAIQLTFYFSISYVIYLAFGLSGCDFLTIISCQAFVLLISSFIPLPGALGGAETGYSFFFRGIMGDAYVTLAMVIWRVMTFYLAIIVGMVTTLIVNRKHKE